MHHNAPAYREQLRERAGQPCKALAGPVGAGGRLHAGCTAEGTLGEKLEERMALGMAISIRCQGCIADHAHRRMENGVTRAELLRPATSRYMGGSTAAV